MGSLVLDKITFAEAKKLEIAQKLGLTGNPTWNQILSALNNLKSGYETADAQHRLEMGKDIQIAWSDYSNFINPPLANNDTIDRICYVADRTFYICRDLDVIKYYELINYAWVRKDNWNSNAPSYAGAYGTWLDGDGVLHFGKTSVYNPTTDNWDAVSDIGGYNGINWGACFPRCFWNDYNGNTHYDYLSHHYVYDKATKTWSQKTEAIVSVGDKVWTDGTTIYYSDNSNQYYLDRDTNTWLEKTWSSSSAISNFNGHNVFYMPEYSIKTYDEQSQIPFLYNYSGGTASYYKFDTTLGYWVKYKFKGATSSGDILKVWYWKRENVVVMYSNGTLLLKWLPINNNWEAIESSKNATLNYLMEN